MSRATLEFQVKVCSKYGGTCCAKVRFRRVWNIFFLSGYHKNLQVPIFFLKRAVCEGWIFLVKLWWSVCVSQFVQDGLWRLGCVGGVDLLLLIIFCMLAFVCWVVYIRSHRSDCVGGVMLVGISRSGFIGWICVLHYYVVWVGLCMLAALMVRLWRSSCIAQVVCVGRSGYGGHTNQKNFWTKLFRSIILITNYF